MSYWVPIGSICNLQNGRAFKPTEWSDSGTPIIRIQNLNDESKPFNYCEFEVESRFHVNSGDLLFSWSGTPGTSFGAFFWNRGRGFLNQHIFKVDVDETRISKPYLRLALNSQLPVIMGQAHGGVGLQHITKGKLESVEIYLPSLSEQHRIAAILGKADALRTKRREALVQLDSLTQSIFVEMFGDPVANEKSLPRRDFGELLSNIDSGWSPVCLERPVDEAEWGVLKLGAITRCVYDHKTNKALPNGVQPNTSIEVRPGDLLFSRKNTYELVAACAYVESTPPRLMMSDLMFRLQVKDESNLNKRYLHALLTNRRKRIEVQKLAGGSAGSMPNISKSKLLGLKIEVPPISEQLTFASRVEAVERAKSVQRTALAEVESLFASIQHRAFRGEL